MQLLLDICRELQKRVSKVEVAQEEPPKEDAQACAVTPRPKSKDLTEMQHCQALRRTLLGQSRINLLGKVLGKVRRKVSLKNDTSSASLSFKELRTSGGC